MHTHTHYPAYLWHLASAFILLLCFFGISGRRVRLDSASAASSSASSPHAHICHRHPSSVIHPLSHPHLHSYSHSHSHLPTPHFPYSKFQVPGFLARACGRIRHMVRSVASSCFLPPASSCLRPVRESPCRLYAFAAVSPSPNVFLFIYSHPGPVSASVPCSVVFSLFPQESRVHHCLLS